MGNDKPASAPPADSLQAIADELREEAAMYAGVEDTQDMGCDPARIQSLSARLDALLAASAQAREVEALCGCGRPGEYEQADGMACNKYMRCKSAAKPVPAAQVDRHVRHIGGSLLAIYENDSFIRDIGPTPGWDFQDRDEFIVRYNAHADHARIVAHWKQEYADSCDVTREWIAANTALEASLAACRAVLLHIRNHTSVTSEQMFSIDEALRQEAPHAE